ncbi:hypothetical protein Plec18170_007197 [Paecilomyces lecythidis]
MAKHENKYQEDDIETGEATIDAPSHLGEVLPVKESHFDPVFGETNDIGPNYRNLGWVGTIVLMVKAQVGLGVLSVPAVFDSVGMIPGILLICAVAGIATWTSYMVGIFKLNHREVYGIDDAGGLMFGKIGREVFAAAFSLCKYNKLQFLVIVDYQLTVLELWSLLQDLAYLVSRSD